MIAMNGYRCLVLVENVNNNITSVIMLCIDGRYLSNVYKNRDAF